MLIWFDGKHVDSEIKSLYLKALAQKIPNCVYLNLDNIIPVFADSWLQSPNSYSREEAVIQPAYRALAQLALDNIALDNTVIFDSGRINNSEKEELAESFKDFPELRKKENLALLTLLSGNKPPEIYNVFYNIYTSWDAGLNMDEILTHLNFEKNKNADEKNESVNNSKLIMTAGLAASGKTTHIRGVCQQLDYTIYLDKDSIADKFLESTHELLGGEYYNQCIGMESYDALFRIADDNLKFGKTCVLDGCFGDKLTGSFIQSHLSPDYKTAMVYFHCSGEKQFERIMARGSHRDIKKMENIKTDRKNNIQKHLKAFSQLAQSDSILFIDTENDGDQEQNVRKICEFVQSPELKSIQTIDRKQIPYQISSCEVTIEEAQGGLDTFQTLLDRTIQKDQACRLSTARNSVWSEMNSQTGVTEQPESWMTSTLKL